MKYLDRNLIVDTENILHDDKTLHKYLDDLTIGAVNPSPPSGYSQGLTFLPATTGLSVNLHNSDFDTSVDGGNNILVRVDTNVREGSKYRQTWYSANIPSNRTVYLFNTDFNIYTNSINVFVNGIQLQYLDFDWSSTPPAPPTDLDALIWVDSDDSKVYVIFNNFYETTDRYFIYYEVKV